MALSFRRSRDDVADVASPATLDAHTVHSLERARDQRSTGALRVEDPVTKGVARIFVFEGHPYSVQISGYTPQIAARLAASGALTADQVAEAGNGPRAGQWAVAQGWITAEQLGAVHQELMIASFGAAVSVPRSHLHFEDDVVTDLGCTVPVSLEPLVESVPVRSDRLSSTWSTLTVSGEPSSAVFLPTGTPLPQAVDRAEFRALLAALGPDVGLDAAAWRAGFTRAEAVHLTGILVAAHVVALDAEQDEPPVDRLLVPEQFGHRPVEAATVVAPVVPAATATGTSAIVLDTAAQHTELHELQAALAAALEEERQAAARVSDLGERIRQLTEALDGVDAP